MKRVTLAWETSDYPTLRKLLHSHGAWVFISDETRIVFDPDELVEAIRYAQERTNYKLYTVTHTALGRQVVLGSAYIRTPAGPGGVGHRLGRHVFLCGVRDSLFFRSESFRTEEEARAAFEAGWGAEDVSLVEELLRPVAARGAPTA